MLEKMGWKAGNGLGLDPTTSIKKSIQVEEKRDLLGIGAKEDFSFEWWDHAYNKTASNINVIVSDGDVLVEKKVDTNFETSQGFVLNSEKDYSVKVSDAELLKACEGRVARRGANFDQVGKTARLENEDIVKSTKRKRQDKAKKSKV